jgi:hypothetical protein
MNGTWAETIEGEEEEAPELESGLAALEEPP